MSIHKRQRSPWRLMRISEVEGTVAFFDLFFLLLLAFATASESLFLGERPRLSTAAARTLEFDHLHCLKTQRDASARHGGAVWHHLCTDLDARTVADDVRAGLQLAVEESRTLLPSFTTRLTYSTQLELDLVVTSRLALLVRVLLDRHRSLLVGLALSTGDELLQLCGQQLLDVLRLLLIEDQLHTVAAVLVELRIWLVEVRPQGRAYGSRKTLITLLHLSLLIKVVLTT